MKERVDLKGKKIGSLSGSSLRAHLVLDITTELPDQNPGGQVLLEFARTMSFSRDRAIGLVQRTAEDKPAHHTIYPNLKAVLEDPNLQSLAARINVTPEKMCKLIASRPPKEN